jgi:uncharacterized protein YndB with AHSA1/START domain
VPNERIVNTEVYEMAEAPAGKAPLNTVTFTEVDGRTTLSLLAETWSKKLRDEIMSSGMEGGMQEGWELLEEVAISLRTDVA